MEQKHVDNKEDKSETRWHPTSVQTGDNQ